jgi:hypothetical protein
MCAIAQIVAARRRMITHRPVSIFRFCWQSDRLAKQGKAETSATFFIERKI